MNQNLADAIAKLKSGDKAGAQRLLAEILKTDPQNDEAWLWMSGVVPEERRRYCLEKALSINPANRQTQLALARLEAASGNVRPAAPPSEQQIAAPPTQAARPLRPSLTPTSPEEDAISAAPHYPDTQAETPVERPEVRPSAWIEARRNTAVLVFLDQETLVTGSVLIGQVKKIQTGLKEGASPQDLLPTKTVIPLANIQEVRELSGGITVTYNQEAKARKARLSFREDAVAHTILDNLERRLGSGFHRLTQPIGAGARVVTILVLLTILLSCVGFFYWGAMEYEAGQVSPTGSARTRGIIALIGLLGTNGVLVIGGILLLLLILYAVSMFARPPQVTILTRTTAPPTA